MELNSNFNKKLEPLINSDERLANWFEINQDCMVYYGLTHAGCTHLEKEIGFVVKVLGRMANACLTWLETNLSYSDEEKVEKAISEMAKIYEEFKDYLSDEARETFYISAEKIEKIR